jgi:hypothetical protein
MWASFFSFRNLTFDIHRFRRLLNRNKKTVETVENVTGQVKRRGILGNLGLKKKSKEQTKEEQKPEEPVEEHADEVAPSPTPVAEESKPLEPEEEEARELDEPIEEEPAVESTPVEDAIDGIVAAVDDREQPVDESSTPVGATSTGFLCGCL